MTISLAHLPTPNLKRIALHVKPAAERAIKQGHPWLFEQGITKQSHEGNPGDLAVVYDSKNRFLAVGVYDPQSPIRVKLLQYRTGAEINVEWFHDKLSDALAIREPLLDSGTTGYRLVHGENDGLPGIVLDRYDDTLVLKLYSAAWVPHLGNLLAAMSEVTYAQRWVLRLSRTMGNPYGLQDGTMLKGETPTAPVRFIENDLAFTADVIAGHKTGFFFDQRDNRALAGTLAQGRSVLDVFAYTGAFAVYCARGGATSVAALDVSEPALAAAEETFARNRREGRIGKTTLELLSGDAFKVMNTLHRQRKQYDMVVIDPPNFTKGEGDVPGALNAYRNLVELGLELLAPQGVFVMASCSSRVSADAFFETVVPMATRLRPDLDEIHRTGHALDHPVGFPEGAYLKCWFARESD